MKAASFYNQEQRSTSTHTKDNEKAVSTKLKQKAMVKNVETSPKFMVGGKTLILAERSTTQKRVQALKPLLPPPIVKDLCIGRGFLPNRSHERKHLYVRSRHEVLSTLLEDSLDRRELPASEVNKDFSSKEITIKPGPEDMMRQWEGGSLNEELQEESGKSVASFYHSSVCY
nr:uncharacterized protein LOC118085692 isoform X2 [Zootoca vivipara]